MVEGGQRLGLALEAVQPLGVRGQLGRQQLERHLPLEPRVLGAIDLTHAARAELLEDAVVAQGAARHETSG